MRLAETHPRARHSYVDMLGTALEAQGRGQGSRLLADYLRYVALDPRPVHLHSSHVRDQDFYRRAGFRAEASLTLAGTGIEVLPITAWPAALDS